MKLGLSSLLFPRSSIEDAVRMSGELGAECVEVIYDIPHFPPDYDQRKLTGLKELIDSFGLEVSLHASFWDLNPATHLRELYRLTLKQVRRSIEACRALGGEIVAVHFGRCPVPDVAWVKEKAAKRYREFVGKCLNFSREHGTILALENAGGGPAFYPQNIEELKQVISELEGVKITFDIAHAHLAEHKAGRKFTAEAIANSIKRVKEYLIHVHLHDNHGEHDEHLVPGEGSIDFAPIVRALKEINYDKMVVVELFDPGNAVEAGRAGLEKTRRLFR
jgi:sugar phosphate isomerase/epimerase